MNKRTKSRICDAVLICFFFAVVISAIIFVTLSVRAITRYIDSGGVRYTYTMDRIEGDYAVIEVYDTITDSYEMIDVKIQK